jgi:benzoyl-CoA reductase/2-hydroxyglutaryl-CoA dehydratase subunit BcrC/BadD/HgdB
MTALKKDKQLVGFTTSFPIEVVYAAGHTPIDLNNIFVLNNPSSMVRKAELAGFPRNICSWIKGMYSVISKRQVAVADEFDVIIGIIQGDCSNTHSLLAILQDESKAILPFSYPWDKDRGELDAEIGKLEAYFEVDRAQTQEIKSALDAIRKRLIHLDELTWKTNQVNSFENHLWLVTSSDFNGDYRKYSDELEEFICAAEKRSVTDKGIRLGFVGVPPILEDLYQHIEECGARVVFNEVQRQFSMFYLAESVVDQYLAFTYPYGIFDRIADIRAAIAERNIDGIISYTQSFCHRQLEHILLKKHLKIPILQLEADHPGKMDERTKLRIESFIEMLDT